MSDKLISEQALAGFRELASPDDPGFVKEFLGLVLAAVPERLAAVRAAIAAGDAAALAAEAHALKSSCVNAEIPAMGALCAELEALGKAGSLQGAAELADRLERLGLRLRDEIHALPEFAGT